MVSKPEKFVPARRVIQEALNVSIQKQIEPLVEMIIPS